MTTTVAQDLKPDLDEREERRTAELELVGPTSEELGARSFDPTQGREIGSDPYDDPTQGRQIGSHPYEDPTQGRKEGAAAYDDPTRGREVESHPL